MKTKLIILSGLTLSHLVFAAPNPKMDELKPVTPEQIAKIEAALPEKAPAKPAKPRNILIVTLCKGFVHGNIPIAVKSLSMLGEKTGAFTATETRDLADFNDENLKNYDAILFLQSTRLDPSEEQRKAMLDFVRGGKGIIGIHAAADSFYKWEEGAKVIGGRFDGHPWNANCIVKVKLDEPDHPINAAFGGQSFTINDEIFQFRDPYSRENQRVIMSLDMTDPDTKAVKGGNPKGIKRTDGDFALAWVRKEGEGRVFYSAFGHNNHIFWNNQILQHYLAGIQYALGDFDVPDEIK